MKIDLVEMGMLVRLKYVSKTKMVHELGHFAKKP